MALQKVAFADTTVNTGANVHVFSHWEDVDALHLQMLCWQQHWCAFWSGQQSYSVASHNFWKKEVNFAWIGSAVMTDFHAMATGSVKAGGVCEAEG